MEPAEPADRAVEAAVEVPDKGVEAPAEAAVEAFEVPEVLDCFPYSSFVAFPPLGSAFKCYALGMRSYAREHHALLKRLLIQNTNIQNCLHLSKFL